MSHAPLSIPLSAQAMPYETTFQDTLKAVREHLAEILASPQHATPLAQGLLAPLWDALRYACLDAGKLLRPVILVETGLALGAPLAHLLPTACAIELVHAQSLVHDDLPCMDDDDLRRGKPTVHKAYGESTAVLVGDALLAMAFGVIADTPLPPERASTLLTVVRSFSQVSSMGGLVSGQYLDIAHEKQPFDEPVLALIHGYKTAALFEFAFSAAGQLAGLPQQPCTQLAQLGQTLGLAFQVIDDILDETSEAAVLGKTIGKDRLQEKATYPALLGLEAAKAKAATLGEQCLVQLAEIPWPSGIVPERLLALVGFVLNRQH